MGQLASLLHFQSPSNDLGLVQYKEYITKYSGLAILKLQTGGDLILAGNEVGTLLVYDISLDFDSPRQVVALSFEYGGVSEICWLDTIHVAVGTTRGRIIVFSIENELKRLVEISTVKAHGDGAAQIAVEGLDFWLKSRCLVSVAEGAGSVRLWDISDQGVITARPLPKPTTAYCTPRYVGFCQGGSQLIIAFMEQSLIQVFSVDPLEIISEFRLGHEYGFAYQDHLGNALVLDSMDRLVVYNMHKGCAFYNLPGMVRTMHSGNRDDGNPYCNQGISSIANASYVASVSKRGVIHILRARDGSRAGSLKLSGRRDIQAIHAASGNRTILVAASTDSVNGASQLTVWRNKVQEDGQLRNGPFLDRNERSTFGTALLCLGVCMIFQVVVSLVPVTDFSTLFRYRSSTFMDQPRHDGGPHSVSQPSITLVTTVVTTVVTTMTSDTNSYALVSVQPSRSSQSTSPPPLQQSIEANFVGGSSHMLSCSNEQALYDSGSCTFR